MLGTKGNRQMADAAIGNFSRGSHYFVNCIGWGVCVNGSLKWYWLEYEVPSIELVFH